MSEVLKPFLSVCRTHHTLAEANLSPDQIGRENRSANTLSHLQEAAIVWLRLEVRCSGGFEEGRRRIGGLSAQSEPMAGKLGFIRGGEGNPAHLEGVRSRPRPCVAGAPLTLGAIRLAGLGGYTG